MPMGAAPMTMGGCSMRGWEGGVREGGGRWEVGGCSMRKHEEAILAGRVVFKLALSRAGCIKCVLWLCTKIASIMRQRTCT